MSKLPIEQSIATIARWSQPALPQSVTTLMHEATGAGVSWMVHCPSEWERAPFLAPNEGLYLAYSASDCVGMAVIGQDHKVEETDTARLRYVFVAERARRQGIADALVSQCLTLADKYWRRITLHTDNPAAASLYRRYGFVAASGKVARITHERFNPRMLHP